MTMIIAYFKLMRLNNCLIAAAAVVVGFYITPALAPSFASLNWFAVAAVFFICAYGNVANDIADIESDRINHPHRPLPSGTIGLRSARILAFFLILTAIIPTFGMAAAGWIIILGMVILILDYNSGRKYTFFWGNALVALVASLPFLVGGSDDGWRTMLSLPGPLIPTAFAFLMHFSREIIKDLHDRPGDTHIGGQTAAIESEKSARILGVYIVPMLLIAATQAVYYKGWFNDAYFVISQAGVSLPLIGLMIWLKGRPEYGKYRTAALIMKALMIPGLIALLAGMRY